MILACEALSLTHQRRERNLVVHARACNCNRASKVNGECVYKGECRKILVVYKAECNDCTIWYLGNTQQKIKLRINKHLGEVCKLVNTGKTSDSFAKHFILHHKNWESKLTIGEVRKWVSVSILWQGNTISCNKSFGKLNFSLYMKERILTLKYHRENPNLIINSNLEFYGACRHKPKFYRYAQTTPLPVPMTNNSSERVNLSPNIPLCLNISNYTSTYVEEEQPVTPIYPLVNNG